MPVNDLLRAAIAIPLMYRPHERDGRQIRDASFASRAPAWPAAGQREDLPVVVLRALGRRRPARWAAPWLWNVVDGGVQSRDTFELRYLPRTTVYHIETDVNAFAFDLSNSQIRELVAAGQRTVADGVERTKQEFFGPTADAEQRAELAAEALFTRHLHRWSRERRPTVFLSYAREDRVWVERLRASLSRLLPDAAVDVWDDSYIPPGSVWHSAITDAILRAQVAVLFVSDHFNRSDFIRDTELEQLRAASRGGRLRMLWLSIDGAQPADPERALQALHTPDQPIAALPETAAAETLARIAHVVEDM